MTLCSAHELSGSHNSIIAMTSPDLSTLSCSCAWCRLQKAHLHNTTIVDAIAGRYFRRLVGGVERVKQLPYPMLDVHCESFIKNPVEELERLCKYLGVPCPRDYITDSTSIVHSKPSLTRQYVDWSDKTKKFVAAELKKHEFLAHYRFEA